MPYLLSWTDRPSRLPWELTLLLSPFAPLSIQSLKWLARSFQDGSVASSFPFWLENCNLLWYLRLTAFWQVWAQKSTRFLPFRYMAFCMCNTGSFLSRFSAMVLNRKCCHPDLDGFRWITPNAYFCARTGWCHVCNNRHRAGCHRRFDCSVRKGQVYGLRWLSIRAWRHRRSCLRGSFDNLAIIPLHLHIWSLHFDGQLYLGDYLPQGVKSTRKEEGEATKGILTGCFGSRITQEKGHMCDSPREPSTWSHNPPPWAWSLCSTLKIFCGCLLCLTERVLCLLRLLVFSNKLHDLAVDIFYLGPGCVPRWFSWIWSYLCRIWGGHGCHTGVRGDCTLNERSWRLDALVVLDFVYGSCLEIHRRKVDHNIWISHPWSCVILYGWHDLKGWIQKPIVKFNFSKHLFMYTPEKLDWNGDGNRGLRIIDSAIAFKSCVKLFWPLDTRFVC